MRFGRVNVGCSFLLLTAWLNYLDRSSLVPLGLLACAVHELGHLLVIRLAGGDIKEIRLTAIGAEMVLDRPMGYLQEGASALAGPAANLLAALLFCELPEGQLFSGMNLVLACFNMLPVGRLDGGRALSCTLSLLAGPDLASWAVERLGMLCAAGLLGAGLMTAGSGGNLTLLLVSFWLAAAAVRGEQIAKGRKRTCHRNRKQVK